MNKSIDPVTTEQLIADFKVVMADTEALLNATAHQGGEEVARVRAKVEESLERIKDRVVSEQLALVDKTRDAARAADRFVHDSPWTAIGVAAGVGLVVGLLSGRD